MSLPCPFMIFTETFTPIQAKGRLPYHIDILASESFATTVISQF
jgi:hypothetical protein